MWMHTKKDRRLPLIPMPWGFVADTLIYGLVYWMVARWCGQAWRKWKRVPRGFPVELTKG